MIFYALPERRGVYEEIVNWIGETEGYRDSGAVSAMYMKYDALKLERIVGSKRVPLMISGQKNVFLFT